MPSALFLKKFPNSCFATEKLVLKIPWKNLYRDPVEAAVERLYLLAVPNQEVKYDPVKEERWAQDAKQNQLNKVEAAKKWEAEKGECFILRGWSEMSNVLGFLFTDLFFFS